MNLFFLAAGLGTRFRPLTNQYPKPSIPFLNVPMGLYQFRFMNHLNLSTCVANSFHLPQKISALYSSQPFYPHPIKISEENGLILGSAGGLKKAASLFSDDQTILMMNADEIFFTDKTDFLESAYRQHIQNNNLATLVTMKHPEAGHKFGAIWCHDKKVLHIGKESNKAGLQPWHYIGIIFLNKKILSLIPENVESNIFYDVLIHHLQSASVENFSIDCDWYETGNWTDYFKATQATLTKIDQKTLNFINQYDASRLIKNQNGISLVSNAIDIDESKLSGYNVIAKTTNLKNISSLSKIENSVLFDDLVLNASYFS